MEFPMNNGVAGDANAGGGVGSLLLLTGFIVIMASVFLAKNTPVAVLVYWFGVLLMVPGTFLYLFSLAKG